MALRIFLLIASLRAHLTFPASRNKMYIQTEPTTARVRLRMCAELTHCIAEGSYIHSERSPTKEGIRTRHSLREFPSEARNKNSTFFSQKLLTKNNKGEVIFCTASCICIYLVFATEERRNFIKNKPISVFVYGGGASKHSLYYTTLYIRLSTP